MTAFTIRTAHGGARAGRRGSGLKTGFSSRTVVVKEILSKWLSGNLQQEKYQLA